MIYKQIIVLIISFFLTKLSFSQKTEKRVVLNEFSKVDVDEFINVTFVSSNQEYLEVLTREKLKTKFSYKIKKGRLYLRLKGLTKKQREFLSKKDYLHVKVFFNSIEELKSKGNQKIIFEDTINGESFKMVGRGNSDVIINNIKLKQLKSRTYGNYEVLIKSGCINKLKIKTYGNSISDFRNIQTDYTRLSAFGNSEVFLNTKDMLRVSGFGNFKVHFKGNAILNKGITLGSYSIKKYE